MKKIIALALVTLMLVSMVACNNEEASDLTNIGDYAAPSYTCTVETGVFTYKESVGDTAIITGYKPTETKPHSVTIPTTVGEDNDKIVTAVGAEAFKEAGSYIKEIVIPEGVAAIEDGAFHSCVILEKITIADTVASIGNLAFYNCPLLKEVVISDKSDITSIGDNAFLNCESLEAINLTGKLESIGKAAFKNTGLTKVETPESLKTIGDQAFAECEKLDSDGCIVLTASIESIGQYVFTTPSEYIVAPAGSYAAEYLNKKDNEEDKDNKEDNGDDEDNKEDNAENENN